MIGFKSTLLNATLAIAAAIPLATAGLSTSAGSAQALTLNGSIGLSGKSVVPDDGVNPGTTSIQFLNVDGVVANGDFAAFLPNFNSDGISINPLKLTKIGDLPSIGSITQATYFTGSYTPFINFGPRKLGNTEANLTFDLDNSVVTRTRLTDNFISDVTATGITGKFNFNGQTIATGFLSASLSGASSTYQLTLATQAQAVPEPTTILALGAVGAVMAMSRRRKSFAQ